MRGELFTQVIGFKPLTPGFKSVTRRVRRSRAVWLATSALLMASGSAKADCAPQAASNVTATCTGATTNQAGGAPGTSGGTAGYGTGTETGVTVNVVAGSGNTVTGNTAGIYLGATS